MTYSCSFIEVRQNTIESYVLRPHASGSRVTMAQRKNMLRVYLDIYILALASAPHIEIDE